MYKIRAICPISGDVEGDEQGFWNTVEEAEAYARKLGYQQDEFVVVQVHVKGPTER